VVYLASLLSLLLSGIVAWLTLRRGTLKMTKPAFIAFCHDVGKNGQPLPKIFIRALLYSTGKRGLVIENMYIVVRSGERQQTFNVWGYGDEKLSRGSGLFVADTGVATNHHFNPPSDSTAWDYLPGNYEIQIFATLPGRRNPLRLRTITVNVEASVRLPARDSRAAIWFDWQPDENRYQAHAEIRGMPSIISMSDSSELSS
jgi:hypothetical protein